jgi:hypothetical protein
METATTNIGTWSAKVELQAEKFFLVVNGEFRYIGEEHRFVLKRNVTQGTNRKDLILALDAPKRVQRNGTRTAQVFYSEALIDKDMFDSVTVPGHLNKNIAFIIIEKYESAEFSEKK